MLNNAQITSVRPDESRGSLFPEKSPVFKDDEYIYALCKDCETGEYGIAMRGLDSSITYEDHSYYPEKWNTYATAVSNFRNMAFKLGLRLLNKNGRVVTRFPEHNVAIRAKANT